MERAQTLYEMVGEENIKNLVDEFYKRVYSDERISHLFQNDIDEVKDKQFRFLCQFFGGPAYYIEKYGHPRMRMRHMPHKIDEKAMHAWLDCMKSAIQTLLISDELKIALYNSFPKIAAHMVNS